MHYMGIFPLRMFKYSNKKEDSPIEIDLEKGFSKNNIRKKSNREMLAYAVMVKCQDDVGISGVKHCCNSSVPAFRRILWIVMIIGGVSVMTWQMVDRITFYLAYKTNTAMGIKYNEVIDFPAIIFCNDNIWNGTKLKEDGLSDLFESGFADISLNLSAYDNFFTEDFNTTEFTINYAQTLKEMLAMATWNSKEIFIDKFSLAVNKYGICYTFNEDGSFKSSRTSTGTSPGLTLLLLTEQKESFASTRMTSGFRLLAYEPGGVPQVTELGYSASVGFSTRISLQVQETISMEPPWGKCNDSQQLEYFESYSYEACRLECETKYWVSKCGCKNYYMPGNARPCNVFEMVMCSFDTGGSISPDSIEEISCDCTTECRKLIYKPTISQAALPSPYFVNYLVKKTGVAEEYLEHSILQIEIYLEEVNVWYTSQEASYDVFALFCDIGGSIGLWIGGSLLTVWELVDIIFNISSLSFKQQ